ncbi:cytochrome P450 [Phaeosphaeriaceae sp. PMI808]|nr:cytochrome P450 [Phaeosphaeriaceae sp. PMI808]
MDVQTCAALSIAELAALKAMHGLPLTFDTIYIFISFFAIQYLSLKIYYTFLYPLFVSPLRHLPGPNNHHFLIGHALNQFRANGPYELYLSWSRRWPEAPFIRYISFGNAETLLVNSLRAHQEVLQTKCYSFIKPPFFARIVGEVTGMGLVFAEGDEHRKPRKLLNGIFSTPNMKKLVPVVQFHSKNLVRTIDQHIDCDESAVLEGKPLLIKIVSLFSKATLDIIGVITLGKELDDLNTKPSFHECYDLIFNQSSLSSLLTAINTYIPLRSWLPLEANQSFVRANDQVKRIIREQIQLRRKEMATNKSVLENSALPISRDILTYLLEAHPLDRQQWSEDELLGYLSEHSDPDYAQIEGLRYLNNFCREVLRVYAPAVMIWRQAAQTITIEGTLIPAGTNVIISPQVLHSHSSIWGSSAETFDPDRWDSLSPQAASPYAFQAFSGGPRVCIGKGLAMLEFKAILIDIVRNFEFEAVESEIRLENYLTLRPKGGLRIIFKRPREGASKRKDSGTALSDTIGRA